MANKRLTTAQRGLGYAHRKRAALLPDPTGQPCPHCGLPMYREQRLDADHETPRVLGGHNSPLRWAHASCNRRAGARLGNARRRARALGRRNSQAW